MAGVKVKIPSHLTNQLFGQASLGNKAQRAVAQTVAELADIGRSNWIVLASRNLKTSYPDYARGLQQPDSVSTTETSATITLVGWLPNAIERGLPAFDMKPILLASKMVKYTKQGKPYIDIPFRHGTPQTTGVNFQKMPESVYDVAKRLRVTKEGPMVTTAGSQQRPSTIWGGRLKRDRIPDPFSQSLKKNRAGMVVKMPDGSTRTLRQDYTHVTSLFADMFKNEKKYQKTTKASYATIRRISLKSASSSWIHPGFEARWLSKRVEQTLNDSVKRVLTNNMRKEGINV